MRIFASTLLVTLLVAAGLARADPTPPVAAADPDFASKVDLKPLRVLAVQHQQTVKTLDSYARQVLGYITGRGTYQGQDPVYTVLDIAFRPDVYSGQNMIKIKNVPLRTEFRRLAFLSPEEQDRIVKTGLVSLDLVGRPEVQDLLQAAQSSDVRKAQAVQQFAGAIQTMDELCRSINGGHDLFLPAAIVPPVAGGTQWHRLIDVAGADPEWVAVAGKIGQQVPAAAAGYTSALVQPTIHNAVWLFTAWRQQDPAVATAAAAALAESVVAVNPAVYPSTLKRQVEVVYNRLAKMTLPGATFYFFAFVCFLMAARSHVPSLRLWGLRLLVLGLAVHTVGIGVRWWLVGSIPIKNEFESVMFSAWFGVLVGFALELGLVQYLFRAVTGGGPVTGSPVRSVYGAAASFIGWLSLIAIFTVPYVFDTSIGQEIGQVNGVLMSYWLYIHVTMVTASYALIGMGFLLSAWWLVKYYSNYRSLSGVSKRQLEGEARGFDVVYPGGGTGGGAASLDLASTLARMVFFPVRSAAAPARPATRAEAVPANVSFLAALDACNLVVLQLAFWVLGAGIVCGAVWADESWGRPWGWDPKETFALITWIVYLIVVHVRVATDDKAWWTAVLSVVGFGVMLFNWIGVNFFLHGLHSYAG